MIYLLYIIRIQLYVDSCRVCSPHFCLLNLNMIFLFHCDISFEYHTMFNDCRVRVTASVYHNLRLNLDISTLFFLLLLSFNSWRLHTRKMIILCEFVVLIQLISMRYSKIIGVRSDYELLSLFTGRFDVFAVDGLVRENFLEELFLALNNRLGI